MRPRRFRFTIGQLITLIAVSAVLSAVLRTPFWPLLPAIGIVLGGFTVDRATGGRGVEGATAAGLVGFAVFGPLIAVSWDRSITTELGWPGILILSLLIFSPMGIVFGFVVGFSSFWVLHVRDDIRQADIREKSVDDREDRIGVNDWVVDGASPCHPQKGPDL
jgi:hypothetical protein